MNEMIFAFATDDGQNLTKGHFGDARYYELFLISANKHSHIKRIDNSLREEEEEDEHQHGAAKKAQGIGGILKPEGVQVLVSLEFGPTIKRVVKKFVCIFSPDIDVPKLITLAQENFSDIGASWDAGEGRKHLNWLKKLSSQ